MSTELLPQRLKSVIAERDAMAGDIDIMNERLTTCEAQLTIRPTDASLHVDVVNIGDLIDKYRKRLAILDARIEAISNELNSSENLTKRASAFGKLEKVKAKAPMTMTAHAIKIDGLVQQLEAALAARSADGASFSQYAIDAIVTLAEGDPTAISRTIEMSIPKLRGHHSHDASALAAAIAKFINAADVGYSIGDFVIVNTSSVQRARTFADVAEHSGETLVDRLDAVLASNGRKPTPAASTEPASGANAA